MSSIVVILGPTATGKSRLSLGLAERLRGEIVSADALQAYRGLDIGTAKPTAEDRRRVPHHLVDILAPSEPYSAGAFAARAREVTEAIARRDRRPIVVGGSGLYLRALLQGISPMPPVDPRLRARLAALAGSDLAGLRRMLGLLDPETAKRVPPGDPQRTARGLEIVLSSGRPQGWWIRRKPFEPGGLDAVRVGLTLPRSILYDRIADRVSAMLDSGWVEEVEKLLTAGVTPTSPAFQAIGYRQLARHLRGEWSLHEAVEETVRATRRFAKRQLTWFRREPGIHWLEADDPEALELRALEIIRSDEIGEGHA